MIEPGGRGFESPFAPYFVGALIGVALLLWVVFQRDIRRWTREEEEQRKRDRDASGEED